MGCPRRERIMNTALGRVNRPSPDGVEPFLLPTVPPRRRTRHEGKPPKPMAQYGESGRRLVDECGSRRRPTATARHARGIPQSGDREKAEAEIPGSADLGKVTVSLLWRGAIRSNAVEFCGHGIMAFAR
jgi:hypothetical protein